MSLKRTLSKHLQDHPVIEEEKSSEKSSLTNQNDYLNTPHNHRGLKVIKEEDSEISYSPAAKLSGATIKHMVSGKSGSETS